MHSWRSATPTGPRSPGISKAASLIALRHKHLPWAHAIVHTHTPDTMAVCSSEQGLVPTNFYSCFFEGAVGYHDFEGITVRAEEGERLVRNLGNHRVLMLRNHGPVVMAETLPAMEI